MNKQRLLNVARALRESPKPERFTMDCYVHRCGTPACALGHYILRSDMQSDWVWDPVSRYPAPLRPRIGALSTWAGQHFNILDREIGELFGADGCNGAQTPIEAAEYIEQFVANGGI